MTVLYLVLKSIWYKPYNCPQKKEFCRLLWQKEMTEFWHQECWQIAESAAHLSLDWQFNHQKCTARLGSEEQRRRTYSFSKALKDELKFEMQTLGVFWGFFVILLNDLCAIFSVVLSTLTFFFNSSERFSVYWSSPLMVWCHLVFSLNFFMIKVVFKFDTCCVNSILSVQGMNSARYSCSSLSTCSVFRTLSREIIIHLSSEILSKSSI